MYARWRETWIHLVDCAVGVRPCLDASDTHGFVIDEAEVTYWGICERCAAAATAWPAVTRRTSRPRIRCSIGATSG